MVSGVQKDTPQTYLKHIFDIILLLKRSYIFQEWTVDCQLYAILNQRSN